MLMVCYKTLLPKEAYLLGRFTMILHQENTEKMKEELTKLTATQLTIFKQHLEYHTQYENHIIHQAIKELCAI